jgi:hypothetical protein
VTRCIQQAAFPQRSRRAQAAPSTTGVYGSSVPCLTFVLVLISTEDLGEYEYGVCEHVLIPTLSRAVEWFTMPAERDSSSTMRSLPWLVSYLRLRC